MSEVKVNKISPRSGTDVALGDSGDSFNVPSGAAIAITGDLKSSTLKDSAGAVVISKSGTAVTIGASGDTVSVASGATLEGAGLAWQAVQTTGFTASAGNAYPCNTTSAAFTVTLPASASVGDQIQIVDYAGTFATNNITLTSSLNIEGSSNNKVLTTNREGVTITYVDVTQGWVATSGVNSGDQAIDPISYSADMLIVAGGGGAESGGGGGGGYRTSTQDLNSGTVYTITVGAGGAEKVNGSNSSISGSGLTTITSAGGGGGKGSATPGLDGGSGGGAGEDGNGASGGSGNVPAVSPSQGNDGGTSIGVTYAASAGGGGAGQSGFPNSSSVGGDGGDGSQSSITGSATYYAGGGGGGCNIPSGSGTGGTGGLGGGGNGASSEATHGTAGTANSGGGGGGSEPEATGTHPSGGSGVVILRVPTANYSSTTTGSPTVTTDGTDTVIKFTGDGTYTG